MRAFDALRLRRAPAIACAVLSIGGAVAAPDRASAATPGPWDDLLNLRVGERRAEFEAGGPVERFVVIASIAWEVAWKNAPAAYRPAEASAEFGRWCDTLLPDLAGRAGEALAAGRRYEAAGWYLLRDRLEQIRGGWALHRDAEEARGAFDRLFGLEAKSPTERIFAFGDLQRDGSVADSPIKAMEAGAVRYLVYLEMLDRAGDASAKGLHATAAARWLIVANVGRWYTDPDPAPMTVADALALRIGTNSKPLDRARAELAGLAVKVLPFFDAERPSSEPLLRLFDEGTVLGSAPIAKYFRLHPGDRRQQAALAEALGAERLVLEIDDPVITLERADRDETETVRVTQSRRVENTAQIGSWDAEMQKLVAEINDLQQSVDSDRAASTKVTAVHGFVTEKFVGSQGGAVVLHRRQGDRAPLVDPSPPRRRGTRRSEFQATRDALRRVREARGPASPRRAHGDPELDGAVHPAPAGLEGPGVARHALGGRGRDGGTRRHPAARSHVHPRRRRPGQRNRGDQRVAHRGRDPVGPPIP